MKLSLLPFCFLLSFSNVLSANNCDITFNNGVIVDPAHIRILKKSTSTSIQITHNEQLFVSGREITLSSQQSALVSQYSKTLRELIPQIVTIAMEGFDLRVKAVNKPIKSKQLKGDEPNKSFQKRFNEMQWHFREKLSFSKNSYYIAQQNFNDFDKIFSSEYQKEIEQIVTQSLGSIIVAVGDAMVEQTGVNQPKNTLINNNEITNFEKELIAELAIQAQTLNRKANIFCSRLKALNIFEEQLRSNIPQLALLDVIQENKPRY